MRVMSTPALTIAGTSSTAAPRTGRKQYLRVMRVRRFPAVTLMLCGLLLGAGASSARAAHAGTGRLSAVLQTHPSVRPRVGRRHSSFELTFTLAQAPGRSGLIDTHYSEQVSQPAHTAAACSPTQPAPVSTGSQGATIKIPLHPAAHGWCKGRYEVTVFLDSMQVCGPPLALPARIICPVSLGARSPFPIGHVDTGQTLFTVR